MLVLHYDTDCLQFPSSHLTGLFDGQIIYVGQSFKFALFDPSAHLMGAFVGLVD